MDEEITALWVWLCSFPQLTTKETSDSYQKDGNTTSSILQWLQEQSIARGVLEAAQEICGLESPDAESESSDTTAGKIWENISVLSGVGRQWPLSSDSSDVNDVTRNCDDEWGWRCAVLSALLCHAVSEKSVRRQEYIARILALQNHPMRDSAGSTLKTVDVKQVLMHIIEKGMAVEQRDDENCNRQSDGERSHSDLECTEDSSEMDGEKRNIHNNRTRSRQDADLHPSGCSPARKRRSLRHADFSEEPSPGAFPGEEDLEEVGRIERCIVSGLEEQLERLREENSALRLNVDKHRKRESEMYQELEEMKANHRSHSLKAENERLEYERRLREDHEMQICKLKHELEKNTKKNKEAQRAKKELASLKDEIDLLQHAEKKLLQTEEQFRRCKTKLMELSDAKEQLAREEEAHGQAVQQILRLENELNQLQPLRRQLEAYRGRATDAEVKLAECQHELKKLQTQSKDLSNQNEELADASFLQVKHAEMLKQQLIKDAEATVLHTKLHGIGEGLSELNPVLKEEILRLRSENERLNEFAGKRKNDAVVKLGESLEDAQRLADGFKQKFLSKKADLEKSEGEVVNLKQEVKNLECDVASWTEKAKELRTELEAEQDRAKAAQKAAAVELQSVKKELSEKAAAEAAALKSEHSKTLAFERESARKKLECASNELKSTKERARIAHSSLKKESEDNLKREREKHAKEMESSISDHKREIDALRQRAETEKRELHLKGKEILECRSMEAKKELKEAIDKHNAMEAELTGRLTKFHKKQVAYEDNVKAKHSIYKRKMQVAQGKISALEEEVDTLEQKRKRLEQEKSKLLDENERFRKQVGSRLGAENNMEAQCDSLQRECKMLLEENKALKKKTNDIPNVDSKISRGVESDMHYSPSTINGSTLSLLRNEHDKVIEKIQDEKRELIMKMSAAVSDMQKAEQRSWELDKELAETKRELTSKQLTVERLELLLQEKPIISHPTLSTSSTFGPKHKVGSNRKITEISEKKLSKTSKAELRGKENVLNDENEMKENIGERRLKENGLFRDPLCRISSHDESSAGRKALKSMENPANVPSDSKSQTKGKINSSPEATNNQKKPPLSLMEEISQAKDGNTESSGECIQS